MKLLRRAAPVHDVSRSHSSARVAQENTFVVGTDSAPATAHNSPFRLPILRRKITEENSRLESSAPHSLHSTRSNRDGRDSNRRASLPPNHPPTKSGKSTKKYWKDEIPLAVRQVEMQNAQDKWPGKVNVILERYKNEKELPELEKLKFVVPKEINVSQFVTVIRNRMNLGRSQSIYLLIDGRSIASASTLMSDLYAEYHDREDGFLYIKYASQEVFG